VIYQDPLAYLLGLEGIALLDAGAGDHDREFVVVVPGVGGASCRPLPVTGHLALPAARRLNYPALPAR
jgi:hypothetical protein